MRRPRGKRGPVALAATAALVGSVIPVIAAAPAGAAVFNVTTTADGGPGSLRQAFEDANEAGGTNTIVLQEGATYVISDCAEGPLVSTNGNLTIQGNGATITQNCGSFDRDDLEVVGSPFRLITKSDGADLRLENVTLEGGVAAPADEEGLGVALLPGDPAGGNVFAAGALELDGAVIEGGSAIAGGGVAGSEVTITGSTFRNNFAIVGGALYSTGDTSITLSTLEQNIAQIGGAIATESDIVAGGLLVPSDTAPLGFEADASLDGASVGAAVPIEDLPKLAIVDTLVASNTSISGGGLFASADVSIERSTFFDNHAADPDEIVFASGGGMLVQGRIFMRNSTVTGNHADGGFGGGILVASSIGEPIVGARINVEYSTIVENVAPDGANIASDEVGGTIGQSVVGSPMGGGGNCVTTLGGFTSTGYNWTDDDSCGLGVSTDLVQPGVDPGLEVLAMGVGPTPTMVPLPGSPLKNTIHLDASVCGGIDQRSIERPQGDGCDRGATEAILPSVSNGEYTVANTSSVTIILPDLIDDPDHVFSGGHYRIFNGPMHGTMEAQFGGTVPYTPQRDYAGPDRADYEVCDVANQTCLAAALFITVTGEVTPEVEPTFTG